MRWYDDTALVSPNEDLKAWHRKTNRGYRDTYETALAGTELDVEAMDWATAQAYWAGRQERRRRRFDDRIARAWGWLYRRLRR